MYCKYISAGLFKLPALMTTHQCRVFSLSWCAWVQGNARKTIFTDVSHLFFQADKKNPFNRLWIIAKEPPNLTSLAKINFFRDHLRGGADDDNYCKQRRPLPSQIWMKEGTLPSSSGGGRRRRAASQRGRPAALPAGRVGVDLFFVRWNDFRRRVNLPPVKMKMPPAKMIFTCLCVQTVLSPV